MRKPWRACTSTGSDHPAATPRIAAPHPQPKRQETGTAVPRCLLYARCGTPQWTETHDMHPPARRCCVSICRGGGGGAYHAYPPPRTGIRQGTTGDKCRDNRHKLPLLAEKSWLSRRVKYIQKFCFYFTHRDGELFSACGGSLLLTSRALCPRARRRRAGVPRRDVRPRGRRGVAQKTVTLRQTKDLTQ